MRFFCASIGVFASMIIITVSLYNIHLFYKVRLMRNIVFITHDYYNRNFTAYVYIKTPILLKNSLCVRDVYALVYTNKMQVLTPLLGHYSTPLDVGFIGKVDICDGKLPFQNEIVRWEKTGIKFSLGNNIKYVDLSCFLQ